MSESFEFDSPDRVTFGTVGEVGQRVFVLQARKGGNAVTLKLEKTQVGTLSRVVGRMLRGLAQPGTLPLPALLELEAFAEPDFVVRTLRVGYDETDDRVVIICGEADEDDDEPDEGDEPGVAASARLSLTREQALALVIRGAELVEAGRPPCPRCGFPLDPRGHVCPRMNGNRPPLV
ncbi:MAG: DUF3090 family protein [Acidimicrobiales bacterium]